MKFTFSPLEIGIATLAGLGFYGAFVHPAILQWGATALELESTWPGDELSQNGKARTTHAITIQAPVADIWPWLLQLGQDRAGFYSYHWLENLFGMEMPDRRSIIPEYQQRAIGDSLWLAPAKRFGENARFVLTSIEPERALVFVQPADADLARQKKPIAGFSWALILEAQGPHKTRLISRSVDNSRPSLIAGLLRALFLDSGHCIMVWKMMQTVKHFAQTTAHA